MKLQIMSDMHLEFGPIDVSTLKTDADVLILAGDIVVARHVNAGVYDYFFDWALANYKHVLMVMGNHEHYGGDVNESYDIIEARWPNLILLERDGHTIGDIHFYGATLWTDMNKEDGHMMLRAKFGMNDFRTVSNGPVRLDPLDTVKIHNLTIMDIADMASSGKRIVVIGHHSPSYRSVDGRYKNDDLNGAYASDLDDFIEARSNIELWIHGHMHSNNDYMIGKTRILANPRGYYGYELNPGFQPQLVVEL